MRKKTHLETPKMDGAVVSKGAVVKSNGPNLRGLPVNAE